VIVCGIDPGQSGGLAFLSGDGTIIHLAAMPTLSIKPSGVDAYALSKIVAYYAPARIWLEKVHSHPKQGVVSTFSFGESQGIVKGVVGCLGLPLELVSPRVWMRGLGIVPGDGQEPKKRTLGYIKMRFPSAELVPERCRVPHSGIVDALAIAEWGRMRSVGCDVTEVNPTQRSNGC
jgi:crossover junction endodeoxyribonuclease RuvC